MSKENDIVKHNQRQLETLKFALTEREQGTFGVIVYDNDHYKDKIYQIVQQNIPDYQHLKEDVAPDEITSLHRYLNENLPEKILKAQQVNHIIHVFNLSSSLVTYDKTKDRIIPSKMLDQLNFERELLFRDFPFIILVWLDKAHKQTFAREAPDLWDWITYIFEFKTPESERVYEGTAYSAPIPNSTPEIFERIQDYQNRLKKLDTNQSTSRLLRDQEIIYNFLAKEYLEAGLYENALQYFQLALDTVQKTDSNTFTKANYLFYLAETYRRMNKFDLALNFTKKIQELKLPRWENRVYRFFGIIYHSLNHPELALANFNQALDSLNKAQSLNQLELGLIYRDIAKVFDSKKNWAESLIFYQKALDHLDEIEAIKKTYQQIALAYQEQGRTKLSELFTQKAQKIS